jgi:hypothetical protein
MDQTAVAVHSHGRLRREELKEYLSQTTKDFLSLVPALYHAGFQLSIATHSDEAEYSDKIRVESHILGDELARALLQQFEPQIASAFFIVAYNPRVRSSREEDRIKRYHIRAIQQKFGVQASNILFFDDAMDVVADCRELGVRTVRVDPKMAFRLSDLLEGLSGDECNYD